MPDIFIPELDSPILFRARPVAIPADLRPLWRMRAVLLLRRKCCRQGRSSLARIHVLNWALRTSEAGRQLVQAIEGTVSPDAVLVRIEPSLNRAVDLARGHGLIRQVGGDRIELTPGGRQFAETILNDPVVFGREKHFCERIGLHATEAFVNRIFNRGN